MSKVDVSAIPTKDLKHLKDGDLSHVSTHTLKKLGAIKDSGSDLSLVNIKEAIDNLCSEFGLLTQTMLDTRKDQVKEILKGLKLLVYTVEQLGANKPAPVPMTIPPIKVSVNDTKPREWVMTVVGRDSSGMIETVKLAAKDEKRVLQ